MTALAQSQPSSALEAGITSLRTGAPDRAVGHLRNAAEAAPADPEPRYWLSSALLALGEAEAADLTLVDARNLHAVMVLRQAKADLPRMQADKPYAAHIGQRLYAERLMAAASLALGRALDFDKPDSHTLVTYGLSLQHQGRIREALEVFSAANELFGHPRIHQYMLLPLFHVEDRSRRVKAAAEHWAQLYANPFTPKFPQFDVERRSDRVLRVGYVGPSFGNSQVAQFLLPVLEAHDPSKVEVFLYSSNDETDQTHADARHARCVKSLTDEEVAATIRADRIDILVDVWGHTAGNRLGAFARKPAPVQIAWINFVQTTGMSAIDYVLHADSLDAPGTAELFVEEVWRMGAIMAPFRPLPGRPDVEPTPALRNGYVTFGCFNNPAKLSDQTVAAWSSILRARPEDRLVLKYSFFADPVLRRATQARFAGHGVDADRIEFRRETTGQAYLAEFQDIDLGLDPSPCPGGTSTCDALSNGVPVLTLKGEDFYARIGLPGLLPCGLPELVAESWEDYISKALSLTEDHHALDVLRQRVRPAFEASPYRDEIGFTRGLEAQYRQMFQQWLDKTAP